MFVIQREDGAYVAPSGSPRSYVRNVFDARAFRQRKDAERERCGNEVVVDVNALLQRLSNRTL